MEQVFPRKIESLGKIFHFVRLFGSQYKLKDGLLFSMDFIIEEIFTNMVKYNPAGGSDIIIMLEHQPAELVLTLVDSDADPFDITQSPAVDTTQNLMERQVGGLGIHLVRQMADAIEFSYSNRQNKIVIRKKLEDTDADS